MNINDRVTELFLALEPKGSGAEPTQRKPRRRRGSLLREWTTRHQVDERRRIEGGQCVGRRPKSYADQDPRQALCVMARAWQRSRFTIAIGWPDVRLWVSLQQEHRR